MARERTRSGCRKGQTRSEARHEQELGADRGNDETSLNLRNQQDQFRMQPPSKTPLGSVRAATSRSGRKSDHDSYKMFLSQCFPAGKLFVVADPYFQFCMMTCSQNATDLPCSFYCQQRPCQNTEAKQM